MEIQQATHRVELGGEVEFVNADNFRAVCDRLFEKYGTRPTVTPVGDQTPVDAPQPVVVAPPAVVAPVGRGIGHIDEAGKARSNDSRLEAKLNGFSPKAPIYAVGTRVIELGVENARASRQEFNALPSVPQVCGNVIQTVAREDRRDLVVERLSDVRMRGNGMLASRPDAGGVKLSEPAFAGLLSRTGIGGHSYLAKCPPELRATNVNHWMSDLKFNERNEEIVALASKGKVKFEAKDAKFRTRLNRGEREIFAVVSGSYGAFDVDKIAQALSIASPDGARGSAVYDGTRAKFDVLFHSNIAPTEYVAGEFFKAGVVVRTDDTGGGAIRVSACIWQNLCLNLIILDECEQEIAAIRHIGSVSKLAAKFDDAFKSALGSIEGFLAKWDYALKDDVSTAHVDMGAPPGIQIEDILPGLFNGIIERELVPVRGVRKEIVPALVRMFEKDKSAAVVGKDFVSRAAVVNAFTRYAHEVNQDPFEQDAIERSAGALLKVGRTNNDLPFEPIDF